MALHHDHVTDNEDTALELNRENRRFGFRGGRDCIGCALVYLPIATRFTTQQN